MKACDTFVFCLFSKFNFFYRDCYTMSHCCPSSSISIVVERYMHTVIDKKDELFISFKDYKIISLFAQIGQLVEMLILLSKLSISNLYLPINYIAIYFIVYVVFCCFVLFFGGLFSYLCLGEACVHIVYIYFKRLSFFVNCFIFF